MLGCTCNALRFRSPTAPDLPTSDESSKASLRRPSPDLPPTPNLSEAHHVNSRESVTSSSLSWQDVLRNDCFDKMEVAVVETMSNMISVPICSGRQQVFSGLQQENGHFSRNGVLLLVSPFRLLKNFLSMW